MRWTSSAAPRIAPLNGGVPGSPGSRGRPRPGLHVERAEGTVSLFGLRPRKIAKVGVGSTPAGAFNSRRGTLLAANVGIRRCQAPSTLRGRCRRHAAARRDCRPGPHALGDLRSARSLLRQHRGAAQVIVVAGDADRIAETYEVHRRAAPKARARRRRRALFACDAGHLVALDAARRRVLG